MTALAERSTPTMLNKVADVTIFFWIVKILATTVGETGADLLTAQLGVVVMPAIVGILLVGTLVMQLRARRYIPWLYWLAVVLISVVGTLLTDSLTDGLGVSLFVSTGVFAALLAVTFALWYRAERTLSIHTITTRRRELFYWAAILFTFALGTAAGDLMGEQLALGYAVSALIFAAMIGLVALAYFGLGGNGVLTFWLAYVLTRPLGASLGDLLSQPVGDGGLGLGTAPTSLAFVVVIAGLVAYMTAVRRGGGAAVAAGG